MESQDIFKILTTNIETFGVGALLIGGLSAWISKVWANRLHEKDKFRHQISQTIYQELFKLKIDIYQQLIDLKIEYNKKFKEGWDIKDMEYDPYMSYEFYYNFILQTREMVDKNKLYVSNELYERYNLLYDKTNPYINEIVRIQNTQDYIHKYNLDILEVDMATIRYEMIQKTNNELEDFFHQIEEDTKQIRNKIDL